jgi:hypothetical protein
MRLHNEKTQCPHAENYCLHLVLQEADTARYQLVSAVSGLPTRWLCLQRASGSHIEHDHLPRSVCALLRRYRPTVAATIQACPEFPLASRTESSLESLEGEEKEEGLVVVEEGGRLCPSAQLMQRYFKHCAK